MELIHVFRVNGVTAGWFAASLYLLFSGNKLALGHCSIGQRHEPEKLPHSRNTSCFATSKQKLVKACLACDGLIES